MRTVRRIAAFLIGFVFFVAGILKLMDPVGASLVVEAYLRFLHLPFLMFGSKFLGVALALLETVTGAALVTGVWKIPVAIVSGIMLAFFTLLTLAIFIFNPEMDCGCFGEAVHLTHAQSFYKNLILDGLWALSFIPFKKQEPVRKIKHVSFSIAVVSVLLFTLWSVLSIPMMDFTDRALGEDIDIPHFSFYDANGEYCDSLAVSGNVMLVSVYDVKAMDEKAWGRTAEFFDEVSSNGINALLLTASVPDNIVGIPQSLLSSVYFGDRKEYMTLNRSNGGATYVSDGLIVQKWASRSLPDSEHLQWLLETDPTEAMMRTSSSSRLRVQGFLLYVFAVMLLL